MYKILAGRVLAPLLLVTLLAHQLLADDQIVDGARMAYRRPTSIPFPVSAPYSPQMATLGKMLFFDPRLSGAQNLSCASCHDPAFGYEVPVPGPLGAANTPLPRKAPTILNAAYTPIFFWDGRAKSLEDQAQGPLTAAAEMNGAFHDIIPRLRGVPEYKTWFSLLFPSSGVTEDNVLTAIATYERTVVTGSAPFDHWVEGDDKAISASAKRGFELFNGKAGCARCHSGWNFTDNQFHDIGLPDDDLGRGRLEPHNLLAQHAFKTPGLRNLVYRAPFGHAGKLPDLASVIAFYESGGVDRPSKAPQIKAFSLGEEETTDLLAFLESLTAEKTETVLPNLPN